MRIQMALVAVAASLGGCVVVSSSGPSCTDGIENGNETDVDCGGSCGACGVGERCLANHDCSTGACGANDRCVAGSSCNDGIQDGDETGIDCGGSCPFVCQYTGSNIPNVANATYRILPGAGTIVTTGTQPGFAVTANNGGSYRLVWTGESGKYNRFWGSVWTSGSFSNVVPGCNAGYCPIESGDYVSQPQNVAGGQRIDFDTWATDNLDGVDFVASVDPVVFDLYIEGVHAADLVFFTNTDTNQVANPQVIPFGLTIQ